MSDIHALSGAYAVDALDDIERAKFERHLATCDSCRNEVDSLRDASALLAETTATDPPASLRERVLADIATVRPLPPPVTTSPSESAKQHKRWFPALVAAAAAVAAIGAGGVIYTVATDDSSQTPAPSAFDQVLQAEDAETYTNTFPGGAKATVVRSKSLDKAVFFAEDMPAPPSGQTYALWLQHDNVMVAAGTTPTMSKPVFLSGDAATATGAGVTVEDDSSAPTTPSDDVVALFEFEQV